MKKYILIITCLFLNTTYSQVLYDENFDSFTLGNLGTDPDGIIPGQDGWLTECLYVPASKDNSRFTITAEPGRGKVLTLSSAPPPQQNSMAFNAKKTGLNALVDQRASGNNVIKLEIDYYTGALHTGGTNNRFAITLTYDLNNMLISWDHKFETGDILGHYYNGTKMQSIRLDNDINMSDPLPPNTWVTFIAYLDYANKKIYYETPYFNKVAVGDFLNQSTSTNLIEDFKPSAISLHINTVNILNAQVVNKYDNIKIIALNAVPPHILSVNTVLAESFNLYPNPATNMVNITNGENHLVNQVVIYDVTGKQLSTQMFNNEAEIQLNVGNLTSGVYMLHIQTNAGTAVKKLVKK